MAEKKRPERRKSTLSGLTPVAPPPAATPPAQAQETAPAPAPAPTPAPAAKENAPKEKKKWPPKVSFYQASEDSGRMRAAFVNTMVQEGTSSLSEFIAKAVAKEVERLEAEYNNGEAWPEIQPTQVPKGPPRRWTT